MRERIIMVGNSSNANRGCEAIARGTLAILRSVAGEQPDLVSGVIVHSDDAARGIDRNRRRWRAATSPCAPARAEQLRRARRTAIVGSQVAFRLRWRRCAHRRSKSSHFSGRR